MKNKQKTVSIPQDLWLDIFYFMMIELDDGNTARVPRIRRGITDKLERMIEHDLYTEYKTATSDQQKEEARKKYLEAKGIPADFRW